MNNAGQQVYYYDENCYSVEAWAAESGVTIENLNGQAAMAVYCLDYQLYAVNAHKYFLSYNQWLNNVSIEFPQLELATWTPYADILVSYFTKVGDDQ